MTSLEVVKQAAKVKESFQNAQVNIELVINGNDDPIIMVAAIIKYMQDLGKENPEQMAEAKELVSVLTAEKTAK